MMLIQTQSHPLLAEVIKYYTLTRSFRPKIQTRISSSVKRSEILASTPMLKKM